MDTVLRVRMQQYTWFVLVGRGYHDNGWLWRHDACQRLGSARRLHVRHRRRTHHCTSGSGYRFQLQLLLHARDGRARWRKVRARDHVSARCRCRAEDSPVLRGSSSTCRRRPAAGPPAEVDIWLFHAGGTQQSSEAALGPAEDDTSAGRQPTDGRDRSAIPLDRHAVCQVRQLPGNGQMPLAANT